MVYLKNIFLKFKIPKRREEKRREGFLCKSHFLFLFVIAFFFTVHFSVYAVSPNEISDLMLWLDASQGVTTDGVTPAVDDDLIQQWDDRSVSAANATQTTPANKPTYKTNILNGNPVIRFSGAQSMVTSSFLDSSFDTDFTFYIVVNKSDSSFGLSTSNQATKWFSSRDSNSLNYNTNSLSITKRRFYLFSPKDYQDYAIESFRYDGSTETLRLDDITAGTTDTRVRNVSNNLGLSGALTIGDFSSGGFNYNGDIAEIIIYNRALSDVELVQVAQYLSTKYDASARTVPAMPDPGLSLPQIAFDGDSMTAGYSSTDDLTYPNQTVTLLGGTDNYSYINLGIGGQTVVQMTTDAVSEVDSLLQYGSSRPYNFMVLMGGTNDLYFEADATTTYNSIVSYLQGRRTAGFEVIVTTILPRSGGATPLSFEADRQTVNSLIRSNWATFADGISDVALDSRVGDEGDELDTTYYAADKVHMTNTGYGIAASYAVAAINQIIDPIAVSDISVTPSTTTADIAWTTNQTGSTQVNYGLTDSYGSSTAETDTDTRVLSHSDSLSDLVVCTTYHFQTVSTDLNGNQASSTDQSFTTTGCLPTTPTILQQFKADGTTSIASEAWTNQTSVVLKVSMSSQGATDTLTPEIEVREVGTAFNDTATNTGDAVAYVGSPVTGTVTISGLTDETTYHWQVRVTNSQGQSAWVVKGSSPDFGVDSVAPSSIGVPTFGTITASSIEMVKPETVTEDGSGLYQWQARRDSTTELGLSAVSTTSVTDSSLSENTQYTYDVQFVDNQSNTSSYGTSTTKYTLADTPTNIVSTSQASTQIGVSVDTFPNYSAGSAGYYFENTTNGSNSGWIQTNSWQNAGLLSCNSPYNYSVKYRNSDGTETDSISTTISTSACESGFLPASYNSSRNSSSTPTVDVDSVSDTILQEINPTTTTPVAENTSDNWAKEFIEDLYEKGIASSNDNIYSAPESNISRAELTKIAIEAFGISLSTKEGGFFPDVPENEWYAIYVQTAYLENIVEGYADGTFGPNKNVSRAEALRVLFDAADIDVETDYNAGFSDVQVSAWYAPYVNYAAENEIVAGYGDGKFGPNDNLTRAQSSKIISLIIGKYF